MFKDLKVHESTNVVLTEQARHNQMINEMEKTKKLGGAINDEDNATKETPSKMVKR